MRGDGPSYAGQDWLGRDLRGTDLARADLRGALLIAADLRDAVLDRTDLLGADLRDTNFAARTCPPRCSSPSLSSTRPGATPPPCCLLGCGGRWHGFLDEVEDGPATRLELPASHLNEPLDRHRPREEGARCGHSNPHSRRERTVRKFIAFAAAAATVLTLGLTGVSPAQGVPKKSHPPATYVPPPIVWGTCANGTLQSGGAQCGFLIVPLDYAQPRARRSSSRCRGSCTPTAASTRASCWSTRAARAAPA